MCQADDVQGCEGSSPSALQTGDSGDADRRIEREIMAEVEVLYEQALASCERFVASAPRRTCMKCPASMCPLIAPNGSPWTGAYDAVCPGHDDLDKDGCAWWGMACQGGHMIQSVEEADLADGRSWVIGPNQPRRQNRMTPKEYDCPKAHECRWQEQAGDGLCPPREAMRRGLDPRVCLF